MRRMLSTVVLILSLLLGPVAGSGWVHPARAAGPVCYVDDTALGSNSGADWTNAFTDLQLALADASCTEIRVAAGTYYPDSGQNYFATFRLLSGVELIGGYPDGGGDSPDPSANPTFLDGDIAGDYNSMNIVSGDQTDSTAVLDGFHIVNGNAVGDGPAYGAGISIVAGSPTLRNLVLSDNRTNGGGGGIYLFDSSPTLTDITFMANGGPTSGSVTGGGLLIYGDSSPVLTRVAFTNNTAGDGGGMYCTGGSPTLIDVTFQGNEAGNGGGGLYIEGGNLSLSDSLFDGNNAWNGAGILVNGGSLDMQNVRLMNGVAAGSGGGIYVAGSGSATVRDSEFTDNSAIDSYGSGGAVYASGLTVMSDCLVDANYAYDGGGLALWYLLSDSTFTNLTVTNNRTELITEGEGGGIYAFDSSPSFSNLLLAGNSSVRGGGMATFGIANSELVNTTIYGNQALASGSAIYNVDGQPLLTNSIVWQNTDPGPGATILDTGTGLTTIRSSILADASCPGSCTDVRHDNPQFADPLNGDFRLLPASPAVDAGRLDDLPPDTFDLDGDANVTEPVSRDLNNKQRVVVTRVDMGALEAQIWNTSWTEAADLSLEEVLPDVHSVTVDRYLDRQGQSRWFKFTVQPSSQVLLTLTGLPANYDLALYRDISQAYQELNSSQDLLQLSAEFAPDTFSPDTFSPDTFSPDTFSPDTFSPDTFSPDTFSPDTFSPDTFSPDTFSPDTFSPDTFSPDTFSPDTFSPDTFSPDTFSPDTFSPDTFSPDTFSPDIFSSAQTRSLIAVSAHEGTLGEGILVNTWSRSGDFYVRVRGRNGAFDADNPFTLQVTLLTGVCGSVSPVLPASNTEIEDGDYTTLILHNPGMTEGSEAQKAALLANLQALAARTTGVLVDVGADARVAAAALQAEHSPSCVYAVNLEAQAVKGIVNAYRALNPLEYIVLVGNDRAIPFFRYADNSLLATEIQYDPPVLDDTTSQASLKSGYILSQDGYGSAIDLTLKATSLPVPDLPVGRLVETAVEINTMLRVYLDDDDGIAHVSNALVTGYDFLEDVANAVHDELSASLGAGAVATLIMDSALSPQDPSAWTADDLRASLLGSSHDIVFLAGHFSASGALAADYKSRITAREVVSSTTVFTNSLVYSAGCHSGYNVVNAHAVPNVTEELDWAQAFAAKGATFIGGTGYQYGDTEFIEYSERLYLDFTRQLRYGTGAVAVGQALVKAKQAYLADTPVMRGLHEKSVLEATLFGLPMMQFDLLTHIPEPVDTSVVSSTSGYATDPGQTLELQYTDLSLTSSLSEHSVPLDIVSEAGALSSQVLAVYLQGPDGVVVNAAEPVLPLDMVNVTSPLADYVLRGIGWRGGTFTDLLDRLPLTGAATADLRAPHPAFFSDVFYPVRPWNVNYFDALSSSGGPTRLAWMPAQYRSSAPASVTGTLRRFDSMNFRLYYSANISTCVSSTHPDWVNTPALAAPPDIPRIVSALNEAAATVEFTVTVTGDPATGIQEAWIVYTFESGGTSGTWLPLDLQQDPADSRLWTGTLNLGIASAADLRFIVQAVNGVGLVTMMTNQGEYYRAGIDPGALPQGLLPLTLTLDEPAASGPYGGQQAFTAAIAQNGAAVAGLPVTFYLGGQGRLAVTGSDGQATANFFLLSQPGSYTLTASYAGSETYAPTSAEGAFEITPGASTAVLEPAAQHVPFRSSAEVTATVTSGSLPLAGKSVALTLSFSGTVLYTNVAVTDYAGQARWQVPAQSTGGYSLTAWFGLPVTAELDLSSPYYTGSSAMASLIVDPLSSTLGDVNGDGLVDSTDALIILSTDVGMNTSRFCPMNCGDVNADGLVDSADALIVLTYDVGMSVPFPLAQHGCPSSITQPAGCSLSRFSLGTK